MNRTFCRFAVSGLLLGLLLTAPALAEDTLLRFRPEPGTELPYLLTTDSEIQMTMGPMGQQNLTSLSNMNLRMTVGDRAEDGATALEFVYDRFRVESKAMGQSIVFDSDDPGSGPQAEQMDEVFSKLTGHPIHIRVSELGRVEQVEGLDELVGGLFEEQTDPQSQQVMEMLRTSFSDDVVRGMMQQSIAVFPEEPVGPGDTWQSAVDISNPLFGGMTIGYAYRVAGREQRAGRDAVKVEFELDTTHTGEVPLLDGISEMMRAQGAEVAIDLDLSDSSGSGTVWFDPATGITLGMEMEHSMTMNMAMNMTMQGNAQKMDMQMKVDSTTKLALEE
jgi:hypothetical protein